MGLDFLKSFCVEFFHFLANCTNAEREPIGLRVQDVRIDSPWLPLTSQSLISLRLDAMKERV